MESTSYRSDVDALRAVAIVLVVAYHAGVPGVSGGFVGVDVFFVLSGMLITRQLVDEAARSGSIALGGFWARRIRRLIPAASLMTATVVAAALVIGSPLRFDELASAATASTLYASNVYFGGELADYFADDIATNPLLHTWSLAVEEQFYLFWPLLVSAGLALAAGSRRVLVLVTATFSLVSFAACWWLTARGTVWAFYASPVRAWEFGLGALVAVALPAASVGVRSLSRGALAAVAAVGLGGSVVGFSDMTPFPGPWALVPAGATAVLLAADVPVLHRLGSWGPVASIAKLSYGWYLWHWPILVLATGYFGTLTLPARVSLGTVALLPAWASFHFVENPVRFSPRFTRSLRPNLALAGGAVAALLVVVAVGQAWVGRQLEEPEVEALVSARRDVAGITGGICDTIDAQALLEDCATAGPAGKAGRPVLLLGDSHAAQWQPAVEAAVLESDLWVVTSWRGNCPALDLAVSIDGRTSRGCRERQAGLLDMIDSVDPAAVILSHSLGYDVAHERWRQSLAEMTAELRDRDIAVGVVLGIPDQGFDPLHCAAIHGLENDCTIDRREAEAQLAPVHDRERAALRDAGHGVAFDPVPLLCDGEECPLRVDDVITYRDSNHLTATFAARLASPIRHWLESEVLGPNIRR